jgi:NAD(P)-dependent dehydrogenase (short-subunit alcohol dehydrogenase family)
LLAADLGDKKALITGGGGGLGRGIALVLARLGVDVAIGDIDLQSAMGAATEIEAAGRRALPLSMDVTSRASVRQAVSEVVSRWGQLDILVNNAGVTGAPGWVEADEDREEDWDHVFAVNLKGMMFCCKEATPHMIERRYGKIVNISSTSGRSASERPAQAEMSRPSHAPYAVSKAGVIRYTQKLASALARHNINVNTVCPGSLVTDLGLEIIRSRQIKGQSPQGPLEDLRRQQIISGSLFGRELTPEDVGKMVAFLVSDDARNITGQAIQVDGGAIMI